MGNGRRDTKIAASGKPDRGPCATVGLEEGGGATRIPGKRGGMGGTVHYRAGPTRVPDIHYTRSAQLSRRYGLRGIKSLGVLPRGEPVGWFEGGERGTLPVVCKQRGTWKCCPR